ncbi:condensation domain-containing protein [Streptosporangium algeriense]|uniref:Condensation domain-containing protein n=1 Tax=Streptosporangium algeriense TaxID=1682748 RepID=A0ABW3E5Z8_9ACTN
MRARLVQDGDRWSQETAPAEPATVLHTVDLSAVAPEELDAAVERESARAAAVLDPVTGPVFTAVLCTTGQGRPARLALTAHHLVVDGVSWRVILDDLERAYRQDRGAPRAGGVGSGRSPGQAAALRLGRRTGRGCRSAARTRVPGGLLPGRIRRPLRSCGLFGPGGVTLRRCRGRRRSRPRCRTGR